MLRVNQLNLIHHVYSLLLKLCNSKPLPLGVPPPASSDSAKAPHAHRGNTVAIPTTSRYKKGHWRLIWKSPYSSVGQGDSSDRPRRPPERQAYEHAFSALNRQSRSFPRCAVPERTTVRHTRQPLTAFQIPTRTAGSDAWSRYRTLTQPSRWVVKHPTLRRIQLRDLIIF